jgi:putative ABC transport system permease protein
MLYNYLKVGVRNLLKYKVFSFINVFGLAAAMSVCMLIILMLADQRSYDQFHAHHDRIYRVLTEPRNARQPYATTPFPLAGALKANYPILEEVTHLRPGVGGDALYQGKATELRGFFADAAFFNVLSYPLQSGDRQTVLQHPNTMVITAGTARRLFGDQDPVGKTVKFVSRGLHFMEKNGIGTPPVAWGTFTVTGVLAEQGYKSHLKFDVLVSESSLPALAKKEQVADLAGNWGDYNQCYTYALLRHDMEAADLTGALQILARRQYSGSADKALEGLQLHAQPLREVSSTLLNNDASYRLPEMVYYLLTMLAAVILLSACLNYTNLSVARAVTRAKEIGVRKVNGAGRRHLVWQFLGESVGTALLALTLAVLLLVGIKPAFRSLWVNQYLNFELDAAPWVYLVFFALAVGIGLLAGAYPALHLSGFQPIKVLKRTDLPRPGRLGLRKALGVTQLVISAFFITTSILLYNQFRHYLSFEYGFRSGNVVNIELQSNDYLRVKNEFGSLPGVTGVSACDVIPATGRSNGITLRKMGSKEEFKQAALLQADEHFVGNLGMKLVAGRNLPPAGTAASRFVLVNRSAVQAFGYKHPAEIVGQELELEWNKQAVEVAGVVEDFRHRLLFTHEEVGPLVLRNQPADFKYVNVQLAATADPQGTVSQLAERWKTLDPVHPFKYEFFDQELAATNQGIFDVVSVLGFLAFLAVTISCLGLLGMATYTTERRRKEVGIRKVLGAADLGIALLLSREFLKMLALAVVLGVPLTYGINTLWLQNFPNRVPFGAGTVGLGTGILLVLGLLTIASQTFKAARSKPVDALRAE